MRQIYIPVLVNANGEVVESRQSIRRKYLQARHKKPTRAQASSKATKGSIPPLVSTPSADKAPEKSLSDKMTDVGTATASGAALGATVGSVVPGIGTAIGGTIGAAVGTVGSLFSSFF